MKSCKTSCPKINRDQGFGQGEKSYSVEDSKNVGKTGIIGRRSPSQSQKSVQIGGVTSLEAKDSRSSRTSEETTSNSERERNKDTYPTTGSTASSKTSGKISPQISKEDRNAASSNKTISSATKSQGSNRKFEESRLNNEKMSASGRSSPRGTGNSEWNSSGHDPCSSSCPATRAKDLATRRAELRQERLDDYLLNKGFSYFDDLCTCSSICLINQLRRDKFVIDMLKSVCLFVLGMKLCDELDAWNIIG